MSQWESGKVPAGVDDALKLVAFAKEMGVQIEKESSILDAGSTEAAKAGQVERRTLVRCAPDHAMRDVLNAAWQGV